MQSTSHIEAAMQRLLQSPEFAASTRLVSFLQYVVEKKLSGEQEQIKAKTIGMDVYGYSVDEIEDRESVVRVDAGRVRRKLEEYYAGSGSRENLRVSLPKGSYVPDFTTNIASNAAQTQKSNSQPDRMLQALFSLAIVIALGVGLYAFVQAPNVAETASPVAATDSSIFDVAPSRLEAVNLAQNGQDLIFPATDPSRLSAALEVFRSAIGVDPNYFGGHAGAAQVFAFRALLSIDDAVSSEMAKTAVESSDRAVALAPDAAWAISAQAFSKLVSGDPEAAMRLTNKATGMAPTDVHIAEFDALISLFATDFERVITRYEEVLQNSSGGKGFVFDNALGSAFFHLGEYENAVAAWERGISRGGPFGPVAVAYLMSAHFRLGNLAEARELAELSMNTWPEARVDLWFKKAFVLEEPGLALEAGMRGAGWTPAE